MKLRKNLLMIWLLVAFLFSAVKIAQAASLILTKIGVLSTVGVDYSVVTYSGGIPTFEGTATPSSQVLIKIKTSTDATTAASPSGAWSFTPGVLDKGNSVVVITSGVESLSLTLIYNATPSATPTATPTAVPTELPASGVWEYYLPVLGGGLLILFFGKYLKDKMVDWEGRK